MPGNTERFEKAMSQGHSEAWDQNWDRATFFYRQALDEIPDHPKAITSLALALYELKAYSEALTYYQRASEIVPDDPLPLEKTSECLEKTGKVSEAVQAYMRSAELYIKNKDVEKAISIWKHVLSLSPENLMAHSRLAIVFERLGQKPEAIREYLSIAALLQNAGQVAKAIQAVERALQLTPESPEAQQALEKIKAGQLLPKPALSKGQFSAQQSLSADQLPEPRELPLGDGLDPIASARQRALSRLAGLVFEQMESEPESQASGKGMQAIVKGKGLFGFGRADQTKILLHLSQVVDLQARKEDAQALSELEASLDAGLDEAAVYFDLGYLYAEANRIESALRNLQKSVLHADYDLGSRLLMGQILLKMGKPKEASNELLEALRIADMQTVPADQAEEISQFYDPVIDEQGRQSDPETASKLCNSIIELLLRENWQENLVKARQQLQGTSNEVVSAPIIDMLVGEDGPFDIRLVESYQSLAIDLVTNEYLENGLVDNIQFTLAWKAGDTEIAELLNAFTSDFMLAPQGDAYQVDGVMHRVYVSVTPVNLPQEFNEGDQVTVMSFVNTSGQSVSGRLWIADDDFTNENNAMYYVSVWGTDFTGTILSLATGLNEIPESGSVSIYPNPVMNGMVNIGLNLEEMQDVTITLMDMQGKEIFSNSILVNAGLTVNTIEMKNLQQGIYFIKVKANKLNTIEKLLVKQKN